MGAKHGWGDHLIFGAKLAIRLYAGVDVDFFVHDNMESILPTLRNECCRSPNSLYMPESGLTSVEGQRFDFH